MRFLIPLVALLATSCASSPPPAASAPSSSSSSVTSPAERVDGSTARKLVQGGATLVDVRTPDEYAAKHIEGAVNVPVDQMSTHDFGGKDKPLVLYCTAGHRSQAAGDALRSQGYTQVHVLGAMSAWGP
jgi:rhodanese-related sulfurtransferase